MEADFSIDPAFELAQLVYGSKDNPGPLLTPDLSFCVVSGDNCATYPRQFDICVSFCMFRSGFLISVLVVYRNMLFFYDRVGREALANKC